MYICNGNDAPTFSPNCDCTNCSQLFPRNSFTLEKPCQSQYAHTYTQYVVLPLLNANAFTSLKNNKFDNYQKNDIIKL